MDWEPKTITGQVEIRDFVNLLNIGLDLADSGTLWWRNHDASGQLFFSASVHFDKDESTISGLVRTYMNGDPEDILSVEASISEDDHKMLEVTIIDYADIDMGSVRQYLMYFREHLDPALKVGG